MTNDNYVNFPESYPRKELNRLYREIPLSDAKSRQLRKYFNALAGLYGVIPLYKAYEVLSRVSRDFITKEEFYKFAEIAVHEDADYQIMQPADFFLNEKRVPFKKFEIISLVYIYEDLDYYGRVRYEKSNKPYYIPTKKELLSYEGEYSFDLTAQFEAFKMYTSKLFNLNGDKLINFLDFIINDIKYFFADFDSLNETLEAFKINTKKYGKKEIDEFFRLYIELSNNTRLPSNCGFTPNELFKMTASENNVPQKIEFGPNIKNLIASGQWNAENFTKQIMSMDLPSDELKVSLIKEINSSKKQEKFVSKNSPCPCGSGKKYKRCCGKEK